MAHYLGWEDRLVAGGTLGGKHPVWQNSDNLEENTLMYPATLLYNTYTVLGRTTATRKVYFFQEHGSKKRKMACVWCLRVVVLHAVDVVLHIHGEGNAVQALLTHHTAEAARVVGLAQRLEDLHSHTHTHTMKATSWFAGMSSEERSENTSCYRGGPSARNKRLPSP